MAKAKKKTVPVTGREAWDHLQAMLKDLKLQVKETEGMIRAIEEAAVAAGEGIMVPQPRRELSPNKETFIAAFGTEVWQRMMRLSTQTYRFVWKSEI